MISLILMSLASSAGLAVGGWALWELHQDRRTLKRALIHRRIKGLPF